MIKPDIADGDIVLVVDDSPDTLGLLNETLEQAGLTVLVALEGRQALTIAVKIRPDIVLLDAIMPKMDGFETCRQIKADPDLADVPVIFMTGLSDTKSVLKGLEAGGVDFLTKPVNPDELKARMRVHLNNARLATSARYALDTTGQHLFTVDRDAQIVWATPQTKTLFARAGVSDGWQKSELAGQLLQWLDHDPQPNHCLPLKGTVHPLAVKLVQRANGHEILLKLVDETAPSGAERLRQALPVTRRESEVLFWIGNGKTNREIGQILSSSPRTINKHLEQIFRKLGVDNRTSAAAIAIRLLAEGE